MKKKMSFITSVYKVLFYHGMVKIATVLVVTRSETPEHRPMFCVHFVMFVSSLLSFVIVQLLNALL